MKTHGFKLALLGCGILSFVALLILVNRTPIDSYVNTIKMMNVPIIQADDDIYRQIEDLAEQINQAPVNAKLDRVWKAIPSYNGVQVNIEKSYQIATQLGKVQLDTLMYDEIEAEISLEEIEPAPIYRGNPKKPMISLMVNVAWGTEYVHKMLDIFDQYQIKVTFFLDGKWLTENKNVAELMLERGHELGNHAYSHPDLKKVSAERIKEELLKTNKLIEELGVKSYLFAPPSGSFDNRAVKIADQYKMKTILWTLDTVDWRKPSPETIIQRIVPKLENGSLILMHPTEPTVEALPTIIEGAMNKELMLGTVSELISPERSLSLIHLK
ncbi:polysaccharide deacetylase family protein [Bacillus horti]|uniref:Sporulation protein (Polysaccharide deacetylase family) n=1 Tax=Caldalkalibacillus horti TaxID=77523 RepID=A0ABT9VV55_9BACI|nr:polysaccharide deacetylase family protein [Bacillus horti]MDQ0164764.1 putative sporulation protein (polysaccharide deacetylase family) [Bacillus horti]